MITEGIRYCDVCEEEIPKGTEYRKVTMKPEAALLLAAPDDPEWLLLGRLTRTVRFRWIFV